MTEKSTEATYVEYKIPAKELRKIAETSVYSNLDCNFLCSIYYSLTTFF